METNIERARPDDAQDVFRLLEQAHLPLDGLRDHLSTTLVAKRDGHILGTAALEVYADGALMRSVAVSREAQGHGLGHELTNAAIALARELGAPAVFLLTTTAEGFFPKFGFKRIERQAVPASVQVSVEFTSACPSTATVMGKPL
jgi:amino-acid N-acetyltransferase